LYIYNQNVGERNGQFLIVAMLVVASRVPVVDVLVVGPVDRGERWVMDIL
jgi:hypothetical protein